MKFIRKVVTYVPTGRQWYGKPREYSEEADQQFAQWMGNIGSGKTVSFTIDTGMPGLERSSAFSEDIIKMCVVEVEIYEVSE